MTATKTSSLVASSADTFLKSCVIIISNVQIKCILWAKTALFVYISLYIYILNLRGFEEIEKFVEQLLILTLLAVTVKVEDFYFYLCHSSPNFWT